MRKLTLAMLFTLAAGSAQAQSGWLDQAQDYVQQKGDDAKQYWQDHDPTDPNKKENKTSPGQLDPLTVLHDDDNGSSR